MQTKQINLKMPQNLAIAAEDFASRYGYRNIQDLALDSLREKIYENNTFDETMTKKEIALIDELITTTLQKKAFVDEKTLRKILKE